MPNAANGRRMARLAGLAIALALHGFCLPAHATSLQISPVRIDLPAGSGAAAMTLRNASDAPIHAQVRVFRWTQANGTDVLAAADDVVASPPILRIAGHAEQLVRVVRPGGLGAEGGNGGNGGNSGEIAYRLLIDELPQRDAPVDQSGIRVQLRYSVPVFAGTPVNAPARLSLALWRDNGEWQLAARNDGARHARISGVTLVSGNRRMPVTEGLLGYALPGATRIWTVRLPAGFTPTPDLRIDGDIGGESQSLPVTYGRPEPGP